MDETRLSEQLTGTLATIDVRTPDPSAVRAAGRHRRTHQRLALAAGVVALVGLVGVAVRHLPVAETPSVIVSDAAETTALTSLRMTSLTTVEWPEGSDFTGFGPAGYEMEGIIDFETGDSSITFSASSPGLPGAEDGLFSGWLVVDGVFYMRLPLPDGPARSVWVRWEQGSDTAASTPGLFGHLFTQQVLAALEEVTDVTFVGDDEVGDAEVRRYRVILDQRTATEVLGLGPVGEPFDDEVAIEVAIDDRDRVRRLTYELSSDGSGTDPAAGMVTPVITTVVEFGDFGVEVDLEPPPADEVLTKAEYDRLTEESRRRMGERDEAGG